MYIPRVLQPRSTERTMFAHEEKQTYGTMGNNTLGAEVATYSAQSAIERIAEGSIWMPRTNTRWSTWSNFRRTDSSPLSIKNSVSQITAYRRHTEMIHCVVCSCAWRLKSRCLGTDCLPCCLQALQNKHVEHGAADPQGLHVCYFIAFLTKITYAAYRYLISKANAALLPDVIYLLKMILIFLKL